MNVNKDIVQGSWHELKGKIRQAWGRLTDDDVSQVQGNWEELAGRIQKTYGYSKERANEEIDDFRARHQLN